MTLSYTQSHVDGVRIAHAAVSKKIMNVSHDMYDNISSWAIHLKKKFDAIVRTEGDLDAITVLKDPKHYKLTRENAFELLEKSGKKIGISVTCRFDSNSNTVEEIQRSIDELSRLKP